MLVITLLLLVLLFILFILFTAIGLTFKLKVLSLEEKKEYRGRFTVKWLLFSHTFSVDEPGEKENLLEGLENSKPIGTEKQNETGLEETEKTRVNTETQSKVEVERKEEIKEKKVEEKRIKINENKEKGEGEKRIEINENKEKREEEKRIEIGENKEKRGIIARIRGKKKSETEKVPETEMTLREKLQWGLKAYRSLGKPLFRLFSDLLNGIKIKRLESYITFGLSDPADTGMLCGCIHAVTGLVYSRCRHCSFSINPVFMNPMVDFRGDIEIRVRIYSLIFPMLKFIFNGKTLSFTYSIIKEKLWGKRKFLS